MPAARDRIESHNSSRVRGSSPVVGSSSRSTAASRRGSAQIEPAAHAARVLLDRPIGIIGQRDLGEHSDRRCLGASSIVSEQPGDHHEVLASGQGGFDGSALAGEPDDPANLLRMLDGVDPGDEQRAGVRLQERGDGPDQRRLARAVRSEHGRDLPGRRHEVQSVEGVDLAVVLGDPGCLDGW